jgi:hypothetical protein
MKPCERWRASLAEFALGAPADPGLAEHVRKCASCSVRLAKMQSLTGEIDRGIQQLAFAEPDVKAAARILAEVASQAEPSRWWRPAGRTIAAAFAAVVFLAVSLGISWRYRAQRQETERALSAAAGISRWKPPTRELLRSPYDSLLKGAPRLGETFYRLDTGGSGTDHSARGAKEKQKP